MRYTPEQLDRKIRTQELVCMVNGWLLEHYEKQKEALEYAEAGQPNKDKKGRGPSLPKPGPPQHPQHEECNARLLH